MLNLIFHSRAECFRAVLQSPPRDAMLLEIAAVLPESQWSKTPIK